ncbi:hypothetical protein CDIK_1871 [Cucumispora dikerogammari]|nr:hypothetical protein CDIK_1871 [Cucumispora dikerogammari]
MKPIFYTLTKTKLKTEFNNKIKTLQQQNLYNKKIETYFFLLYKLIQNYEYLMDIDFIKLIKNNNISSADVEYLEDILNDFLSQIPYLDVKYCLSKEYNICHYGMLFPFILGIFICFKV